MAGEVEQELETDLVAPVDILEEDQQATAARQLRAQARNGGEDLLFVERRRPGEVTGLRRKLGEQGGEGKAIRAKGLRKHNRGLPQAIGA